MLDQNTDRMWYVIGAIIVGGLILTSSIILFTDVAFAGVQDAFTMFSSVRDNNILTVDNMFADSGATMKIDSNNSVANIRLDIRNKDYEVGTGGLVLDHKLINFKPSTKYILTYDYQKVSGTLSSFGGHIDSGFNGGSDKLYLNGELVDVNYNAMRSVYVDDSYDIQSVEVHFTTESEFNINRRNYIWVQPNRGSHTNVVVNIYNLKLVEVVD